MKKLKRMTTNPITKSLGMNTLYEYHAKVGTTSSTIVWLFEKAAVGKFVYGYCEEGRYTPYMGGHAFRYAEAEHLHITDIYDMNGEEFLVISKG